jgi:hypothetical protein
MMNNNKKTLIVVSISVVFALGLGIAIGSTLKKRAQVGDKNITAMEDMSDKSIEELGERLSEFMLPENEFTKLQAAILQAGLGLFMSQAQTAGIQLNEDMQKELKDEIDKKYDRKFFASLNAGSMKELSKDELISIIAFYHTEAGKKFLEMSPKIIQNTMTQVQTDLSAWLPKTVETLVAKLKDGGGKGDKKEEAPAIPDIKANPDTNAGG